jgi:hypothetical protein
MTEQIQKNSRWRRWGKWAGIFVLVIAGILLTIQILFSYFAESYLKQQIETAITDSAKQLRADVGNLQLSTLKRQIIINNIRIYPTSTNSDSTTSSTPVDSIFVDDITFNGMKIFSYLWNNRIALDYITIDRPRLYLVKPAPESDKKSEDKKLNKTIYEGLKSYAKSVEIDDFLITGLSGALRDSASETPFLTTHNARLHLADIRIDSAWAKEEPDIPGNSFSGSLDSLNWTVSSKLYDLRLTDLGFSSRDSSLTTKKITLVPRLPKYEFAKSVGHEIDRIELDIGETELVNVDLPALIEEGALNASAFYIKNSRLEVFHDKKQPADQVEDKVFPQVKFSQLEYPVRLDSIIVTNFDISYSEHLNRAPEPGFISFENTYAVIRNVYNTDNKSDNPIRMDVNSEIMGEGRLEATFEFPVSGADSHNVAGNVESISLQTLNPALKYLGRVEATSGQIHSIDFKMNLGAKQATGNVYLHYTDLKIKMIDFDDKGNEDSDNLKSFLANTFVLKEKNEPPLREGEVSHERLSSKSIFNYWWKSLLSGLKSSIGL